jgi:hypothetical protein
MDDGDWSGRQSLCFGSDLAPGLGLEPLKPAIKLQISLHECSVFLVPLALTAPKAARELEMPAQPTRPSPSCSVRALLPSHLVELRVL